MNAEMLRGYLKASLKQLRKKHDNEYNPLIKHIYQEEADQLETYIRNIKDDEPITLDNKKKPA